MDKESIVLRGRRPGARYTVDIKVVGGRIAAVLPAGNCMPDVGGDDALIAPGFFDLQINGAGGYDLQSLGMTGETVYKLNAFLNANGVFYWMSTLVTDSADALEYKCRVLADAMSDPALARHIPGIHLEGPHISPLDGPRGAHPAAYVVPPNPRLFDRLQRAANGRIRYMTLAPELPGALPFIRRLKDRGVLVALGHHAASVVQIRQAVDAGARLCTHLGNGMAPQMHRHQNALWPQLAEDRLHASMIADLEHLPPEMLRVMVRAKTARRVVLVSDSVFLAGMKPGRYSIFGADVEMKRSGRVCLAGTELLAGSSLLLPEAVMNMIRVGAMSPAQACDSASRIPARLLDWRLPAWRPRVGQQAHFVLYPAVTTAKIRPELVFWKGERLS